MPESMPQADVAVTDAAVSAGWSHRHRDVSGGWLLPTVFGAVDGLVTNAALIAGVGGGGAKPHAIVLTGLAGLVAGAFSMGTGEYVSVTNRNELVHAEADTDAAVRMAEAVSRDPETALRVHTREELGVDHHELPSPVLAGVASLIAFSLGAVLPLLPYLIGFPSLVTALMITAVALASGGMAVGRLTGRPLPRAGARQLALGAVAIAVTFAIGHVIGSGAV